MTCRFAVSCSTIPRTPSATTPASFLQRGATWLARHLCGEWGIETAQALGPASALLHRARAVPADLTILHTEIPILGRPASCSVTGGASPSTWRIGIRRICCCLPTGQSQPIRLLRAAEKFALQHCAYASSTSQSMADALVNAYGCPPPQVIRNTFPLQLHARSHEPGPNDVPRFIWFSQTIGPGRGLELFFAAWSRTRHPSHVYLLGDERPGYREKIMSRLPAARRANVHFIPLVAPDDLPQTGRIRSRIGARTASAPESGHYHHEQNPPVHGRRDRPVRAPPTPPVSRRS